MIKSWLISFVVKFLTGAIILGVGVWYLSSSIGGASLSYTSIDNFMQQIGVQTGDIAHANGCFLCTYIAELFDVLGRATTMFWNGIVRNLWILMAVGFGIFIIVHTIKFFQEHISAKDIKDLSSKDPKLDFKKWFDKVWKTGVRVLVAGTLIGALNWSGISALQTVSNITVKPVLYIGSVLSMATTKIVSNTECKIEEENGQQTDSNVLTPVLKPFMCTMGNLNAVMLAGSAGGFALMNYAWLDMGGGFFTRLAGLALVLVFLIIGFDLIFQILSVIFKLIFIIVFLPILIAAYAFEETWSLAKGLIDNSINILVRSAIAIVRISLKICIIYAVVYFSADSFYPGPVDGFTTIMPPLLNGEIVKENPDTEAMSVMSVFSKCEKVALVDGKMDKDVFKRCFLQESSIVQQKYPKAFDFMEYGFDFFIFMIGIAILYFWIVSPKIDAMLGGNSKEEFDFGGWLKDFGKLIYSAPEKIYTGIKSKLK